MVGPTAVGKTRLALELAQHLDAEIVAADSRQVYRHLDIGTGKATRAEQARARHHLLDVVAPDVRFDVADYVHLARRAIVDIAARGRAVVVCGGTGLYVKALLRGLFPGPKADPGLREKLLASGDARALHDRLSECDAEAARRIHPHDLVRTVRALEVHTLTGRSMSEWQRAHGFATPIYDALVVGLWRERDTLRRAIAERCEDMIRQGLVEEVRSLWTHGFGPDLAPLRTLGYRHMGAHLRAECTLAEALAGMIADTGRYAKRQVTWFRGEPEVRWFEADDTSGVLEASRRFLER